MTTDNRYLKPAQIEALRELDIARVEGKPYLELNLHGRTAGKLIELGLIESVPTSGFRSTYRITDAGTRALINGQTENGKSLAVKPEPAHKFPVRPFAEAQFEAQSVNQALVESVEELKAAASQLALALLVERVPEAKGLIETFSKADEAVEKAKNR